ncbi:MAG: hypothetical protein IKF19_00640 [Bacilli bacterium]|nr:hypothetical protein [Bacilli bacterium]
MKESTGELGGTVVVIIALIALVGIISALNGPLKNWVNDKFNDLTKESAKPTTIVTPVEDGLLR